MGLCISCDREKTTYDFLTEPLTEPLTNNSYYYDEVRHTHVFSGGGVKNTRVFSGDEGL